MPQPPFEKLYLIDASGFIFRAFHALPPLNRPDGTPVGAVLGFLNILLKLLDSHNPPGLAIVFDVARHTFRHTIDPHYKANRAETPIELIPQFSLVRDACQAFNLPIVEKEGFEADDVMATYTCLAQNQGISVTLVSSDKDLMQLICDENKEANIPGVCMYDPIKQKEIRSINVFEKFGVDPCQVVEVQALIGDSSDNVPGVPGIGVKTAATLIQKFGTLERLFQNLHQIPQEKRRNLLTTHEAAARLSYELVCLRKNIDQLPSLETFIRKPQQPEKFIPFLEENHFHGLLNRFKKMGVTLSSQPKNSAPYTLIQDTETLKQWRDAAKSCGQMAIDTETTSLSPTTAQLVGISLAIAPGQAAYIPLRHQTTQTQLPMDLVLDILRPILQDPCVLKIGHNLKYDALVLKPFDVSVHPFDDTLLLSYALDGTTHLHGLDFLAQHYLNHTMISFMAVTGKGKDQVTFDHVPLDAACQYAAEDADITLRLHSILKKRLLEEKITTVYETLDRPLLPVLAEMEYAGIRVDPDILENLSTTFAHRLQTLESAIHTAAGSFFNVGSPKQVGEILFDHLGLPGGKRGKTGAYNTGADVLENLSAMGHTLPQHILEWRQLAKLKSTYTDSLPQQINPKTGRIHTSYMMTGTSTGRLSSTDPNLQNIPIRTPEGKSIRKAFIASEGFCLVSLDYSQIELRLLAHMGDISSLKNSFLNHQDVHTQTASEIFGVPQSAVTPETRRQAKAINFGIIYGISPFGLGQQLGISTAQATAYMQFYFNRYPGIQDYMEKKKEEARKNGFVTTLMGRRCFIPTIHHANHLIRTAAERQAINAPLQGSSADIIKRSMIAISKMIEKENLPARLLLQVHDELVFEIPLNQADDVIPYLKEKMRTAATLSVPLEVEEGRGSNWQQAHL